MYGLDDPDCALDLGKLTATINVAEGLRLFPYVDAKGKITIGYGTNLSDGISNDEAKYLRDNRLREAIEAAQREAWWPHVQGNDVRTRALCELIYNMGINVLRTFTKALA